LPQDMAKQRESKSIGRVFGLPNIRARKRRYRCLSYKQRGCNERHGVMRLCSSPFLFGLFGKPREHFEAVGDVARERTHVALVFEHVRKHLRKDLCLT
jgi:hypothetical protein